VTVNTDHNPDIVRTRISQVSRFEQTWIDALFRSGLNLKEPFTAKEGAEAIKQTPLSHGGTRLHNPNSIKLCFVMKKTKMFERILMRRGSEKVFWKLITDE